MRNYIRNVKFIIIVIVIVFWSLFGPVYKCKNVDKKSEWYVNDLYMSDQYYYDNLLNDNEKNVYKQLFDGMNNIEKQIKINTSQDALMRAWDALMCDHPEMINITTFSYKTYGGTINVFPIYLTTSKFSLKNKERKMRKKIGKVRGKIRSKSDYEKEKYIYEYLAKHNTYSHNFNYSDQSAYTAFFITSGTVCAGYAKAAQLLLSNCGINSMINIGPRHLWNTVELEGEYYFFDATVSTNNANREMSLNNVSYRGLNQNFDTSSYEFLYQNLSPNVTGEKYNYYNYNNLTLTYDNNKLEEIKKIIDDSEFNVVEIKFTNCNEAKIRNKKK